MIEKENLSVQTLEDIEKSKSIVNNFYKVNYSYPISIAKSTIDIVMSGLLPWAKSGIRKTIVIRIPGITQNQITHEMSHFALRSITGNKGIPLWFDEGLACYISNMDFIGDKQNLKMALQTTISPNIVPWKGVPGKFHWLYQMYIRKNTNLIYGESFYMIEYLLGVFNHQMVLNFIISLGNSDFEHSFNKSFGISQTTFYRNFLNSLK